MLPNNTNHISNGLKFFAGELVCFGVVAPVTTEDNVVFGVAFVGF